MTGLKQRIFRRRASGSSSRGAAGLLPRLKAGMGRLRPNAKRRPWGRRAEGSGGRRSIAGRLPWGKRAEPPAPLQITDASASAEVVETAGDASFRDRGRMRRRLRFLRRARELAFRDVGGLIFDMRRFERDRPDLVEAKLSALAAVDQELRALERVLDDRRPIHELREPGLSSCQRCGALHASEDNFCPHCGLQFGGPQAMGEVGGAIAAPPLPPPGPVEQPTSATLIVPGGAAGQPAGAAAPAPGETQGVPAPAPAPPPAPGGPGAPQPASDVARGGPGAPQAAGDVARGGPGANQPASDVPDQSADEQQQQQRTQLLRPPDAP